ncbi:phage portal protein [Vibrio sp. OPT18]|uniref:phage portal protein n=1 Tax=Vibrio sp. OPT18 TaxID=2778641 RepID=UPI00187F87C5|nr:phage portal protein [Vibrio sp. OPT18]MBE8574452.1 phage portal protein [Vibrio sp. OPT18]
MFDISFDVPESIMKSDILSYTEVALTDGIYEPPIALDVFAKAARVNATHGSALYVKRNMLSSTLMLPGKIKRRDLKRFLDDCLIFGNGYLLAVRNRLSNEIVQFKHLPALYMRRKASLKEYCYKPKAFSDEGRIDYRSEQVFHWAEYDVTQEIYGLPQYVGAMPSIWLSEDATLFRRKYYVNGSHAGFLLYLNDPNMTAVQEEEIKAQMKKTGGLGAFKNLFINAKGRETSEPKLIPIGQLDAKDAFKDIKSKTTNDVLASHRVPLDLMSIDREGFAGSSDLNKVDRIFYKNELVPFLESICDELFDFCGEEIMTIKEYEGLEITA